MFLYSLLFTLIQLYSLLDKSAAEVDFEKLAATYVVAIKL